MNKTTWIAPLGRFIAATVFLASAAQLGALPPPPKEAPPEKVEPPKNSVREAILVPLKAAQALIKDKKHTEALAEIAKTDAVADQTPFEVFLIQQLRGDAAAGAGQYELAIKSLEAALATEQVPPAKIGRTYEAMASLAFQLKDYKRAAAWAAKALNEGGSTNLDVRYVYAFSSYSVDDFATAVRETKALLAAGEQAGSPPKEGYLRMLASSYYKLNDTANYKTAVEKLVTLFPKREYWADLVYRVESNPKFSDRLMLDSQRLKLQAGLLATGSEYTEMAESAMQAGYSLEAQRVLEAALKADVERTASDVARQKKLMDNANKEVAEEKKRMARGEASTSKTAIALVNNGFNYVLSGQAAKGIAMMEDGVKAPGLKNPDDARLRLGVALVYAGEKDKALAAFDTVKGTDGASELAHLWMLLLRQPPKS